MTEMKFGAPVENISASEDNPMKRGFFVRKMPRFGGPVIEYTNGHGDFSITTPDNLRCSQGGNTSHDLSCAADFLDDIEVDADGKCNWTEVANAQTHIRAALRCWSAAPPPSPPGSEEPCALCRGAGFVTYRDGIAYETHDVEREEHLIEDCPLCRTSASPREEKQP
jgi:hypothetical protein